MKRSAFTVMELLVSLMIVVVLGALLAPALSDVQHTQRDARCKVNLHTIGAEVVAYLNEYKHLMTWHEPTLESERATFDLEPSIWLCPEMKRHGNYPYAYIPGVYMADSGYAEGPTPQGVMTTRKLYEMYGNDPVFVDVGAFHWRKRNQVSVAGVVSESKGIK